MRSVANSRPTILKNRNDFSRLKAKGKTVTSASWLIANYSENDGRGFRIGWTIPTYVGTAVIRNRFKRWIRCHIQSINSEILNYQCDINLVFRRRSVEFYKTLSHGELDIVLGDTLKKIKIRRK